MKCLDLNPIVVFAEMYLKTKRIRGRAGSSVWGFVFWHNDVEFCCWYWCEWMRRRWMRWRRRGGKRRSWFLCLRRQCDLILVFEVRWGNAKQNTSNRKPANHPRLLASSTLISCSTLYLRIDLVSRVFIPFFLLLYPESSVFGYKIKSFQYCFAVKYKREFYLIYVQGSKTSYFLVSTETTQNTLFLFFSYFWCSPKSYDND